MNKSFDANIHINQQRGAVLIISLVILLVVTVLGVSAMSSSTLELKMAANAQNHQIVIQASDSAIESTLNNLSILGQAIASTSQVTHEIMLDSDSSLADQPVKSNALVNYIGESPVDGFSLGVNKNTFIAHNFEVIGTGTMSGGVRASTAQGVFRIGPSGS